MSPYLNEPYTSATEEVLSILKNAWNDRKTFFYIAVWPIILPLMATVVASAVMSQIPGESVALVAGLLSALVSVYAITLTEVRVYRFVALEEGRGENQVAPLRLDPRMLRFMQYKLLLSIPSMILPLVFGLSAETVLFMFLYHLFVLRVTFLFTAISLDSEPSFKMAWNQIGPVFIQLILVELVFAGFALLALMPVVSLVAILFGQGSLKVILLLAAPLRIIFTQLLAVVDMRFYNRAVLSQEN